MRRWRTPALIALAVLVLAVAIAALAPRSTAGDLDPDSPAPAGSRALAQVLGEQGVQVTSTDRFAEVDEVAGGGDATVLVVGADLLEADLLDTLTSDLGGSDVVLVRPSPRVLEDLDLDLLAGAAAADDPVDPGCDVEAARVAGSTQWDDAVAYQGVGGDDGDVTWCYPSADAESPNGRLLALDRDGTQVVVLGSTEPLVNEHVAETGNAAVGLHLLGGHRDLVWWKVDPLDPALVDGGRAAPGDLAPPWVGLVSVWLVLVAALAVLWRGRRFGPLVPEPLPVVVRSAETARGRAALYRESGARDRAATVLRAEAVRRLALRLGLSASAPAHEVVTAAAARSGPDAAAVRDLLAGPPPADDLALARLAEALDALVDPQTRSPQATDRKAPAP